MIKRPQVKKKKKLPTEMAEPLDEISVKEYDKISKH